MHPNYRKLTSEDFSRFDKNFRVHFFNSLSGYKSVNLCGTKSKTGNENLSIYNSIVHIGSQPPLLGMMVYPPTTRRDTLTNIRETGYFSLNHITEKFYFKAHQTAASYPSGKSEFEAVNLTPEYSNLIHAPYVKESPIKIGLKLEEEIPVKSNGKIIIIGRVLEVILPENCILNDGMIDLGLAGTITVTGLDTYCSTSKIARLSFAKTDDDLGIVE